MSVDYGFFEASLAEQRTYRAGWNREQLYLLKAPHIRSHVKVLSRRRDDFRFRGTHVMNPGYPLGLARVNERFNITLPEDIDAFYRRWNGGLLLFREFYQLLSADQIIEHNMEMRRDQVQQEPISAELPWHLVRFCMNTDAGEYLSLRLDPIADRWHVFWASHECWDRDYIADAQRPLAEREWLMVDPDFRSWLKRMCATDGWPECDDDPPQPAPAERIA